MREIHFRGICKDSKRWAYGYYVHFEDFSQGINYHGICSGYYNTHFEVIPETVGQYTGLKDLHNTRIFEGDVCKAYICKAADTVEKEVVGVICFEDGTFEFKCEHENIYLYPLIDVLEVIGNIHDNPELLEVKEHE